MTLAPSPSVLDSDACAEAAQHALAVIAARCRLDHTGLPRRVEAGEQHRRLHLRRRHRQPILDRQGLVGADHGERQTPAAAGLEARAHPLQRLDDPAHRPPPERGVAGHEGREPVTRTDPRKQTHRSPGVAEVKHVAGLGQPADADAMDAPATVVGPLDCRAEGAKRCRRRRHVLPLQEAAHPRLADRERPQHERTVGDRLVARHGARALQGPGGRRDQGVWHVLSGAVLALRAQPGHGLGQAPSLAQRRAASSGSESVSNLVLTGRRQTGIGDGHNWHKSMGGTRVAKREWGAKHTCMGCGVKFYDLHRNPVTCPKCGTEIVVETTRPNFAVGRRRSRNRRNQQAWIPRLKPSRTNPTTTAMRSSPISILTTMTTWSTASTIRRRHNPSLDPREVVANCCVTRVAAGGMPRSLPPRGAPGNGGP